MIAEVSSSVFTHVPMSASSNTTDAASYTGCSESTRQPDEASAAASTSALSIISR